MFCAGFDLRYEGLESDATIEQLLPGHCYSARVRCFNGEQYSDVSLHLNLLTTLLRRLFTFCLFARSTLNRCAWRRKQWRPARAPSRS